MTNYTRFPYKRSGMVFKQGTYNYGPFYGCSNYPNCKNVKAISLNKDLYNTF